jgi:hypothetical protein
MNLFDSVLITGGDMFLNSGNTTTVRFSGTASFNSYINNGGNFGIGTPSPPYKLSVSGSTYADARISSFQTNTSERASVGAENSGDYISIIQSGSTYATDPNHGWNIANSSIFYGSGSSGTHLTNNGAGGIKFWTGNGGSSTQRVVIDNLGYIGINTINPQNRLEVRGSTIISDVFVSWYGDGQHPLTIKSIGNKGITLLQNVTPYTEKFYLSANDGSEISYTALNTSHNFYVGSTSIFKIIDTNNSYMTNNLGIGMNIAPNVRLHVKGSGSIGSTFISKFDNVNNITVLSVRDDGHVSIGSGANPGFSLAIKHDGVTTNDGVSLEDSTGVERSRWNIQGIGASHAQFNLDGGDGINRVTLSAGPSVFNSIMRPISFGAGDVASSSGIRVAVYAVENNDGLVLRSSTGGERARLYVDASPSTGDGALDINDSTGLDVIHFKAKSGAANYINNGGGFGLGTSPIINTKLHVKSLTSANGYAARFDNSSGIALLYIQDNGRVGINQDTPTANLHIKGSGSTGTTNSLLVTNSLGAQTLSVSDDKIVHINSDNACLQSTLTDTTGQGIGAEFINIWSNSSLNGANFNGVTFLSKYTGNGNGPFRLNGITSTANIPNIGTGYGVTNAFQGIANGGGIQQNAAFSVVVGGGSYNIGLDMGLNGGVDVSTGSNYGIYYYSYGAATSDTWFLYGLNDKKNTLRGGLGIGLIGLTAKLHVQGIGSTNATFTAKFDNASSVTNFSIQDDGLVLVRDMTVGRGAGFINTNTALGVGVLGLNNGGDTNTGLGYFSLYNNTTGGGNTAVGYATLDQLTTGSSNTSMGSRSMSGGIVTGSQNSGFGFSTLNSLTTGTNNTSIGFESGNFNTIGINNTGIGAGSIKKNINGNNNTGIGHSSLNNLTGGDSNIALGYLAGYNQINTSNKLFIDNQDRGSSASELTSSLIYGVFDPVVSNQTITFNAKVGVGITIPTASLNLQVGTTASNTSPIKFTTASAALLTTPESGAFETDGTDLYFTNNAGVRKKVTLI